jgi:hypothetical protein
VTENGIRIRSEVAKLIVTVLLTAGITTVGVVYGMGGRASVAELDHKKLRDVEQELGRLKEFVAAQSEINRNVADILRELKDEARDTKNTLRQRR